MKTSLRLTRRFFTFLIVASLMVSCSQVDVSEDSIGPKGSQGEQGPKGDTGTANVVYLNWIPSGFPANVLSETASFAIAAPLLTEDIRNNGMILVYRLLGGLVYGLPASFAETFQEAYFFRSPAAGELELRIHSTDGSNIGDTVFVDYRYILMADGTSTGKSASSLDHSKMTYQEIVERFSIPK